MEKAIQELIKKREDMLWWIWPIWDSWDYIEDFIADIKTLQPSKPESECKHGGKDIWCKWFWNWAALIELCEKCQKEEMKWAGIEKCKHCNWTWLKKERKLLSWDEKTKRAIESSRRWKEKNKEKSNNTFINVREKN